MTSCFKMAATSSLHGFQARFLGFTRARRALGSLGRLSVQQILLRSHVSSLSACVCGRRLEQTLLNWKRGDSCDWSNFRFDAVMLPWKLINRGFKISAVLGGGVDPILVKMPALSPTMEEGTITQWLAKEGDELEAGDQLCEVETDKAVVPMECDYDATLAKILVPEGKKGVKIGTLIALMVEPGEDPTGVEVTEVIAMETSNSEATSEKRESATGNSISLSLSPAVRHLVETHGLDSSLIPASGPGGRLLKGDVLKYMEDLKAGRVIKPPAPEQQPVTPARPETKPDTPVRPARPEKPTPPPSTEVSYTDIPVDSMRGTIAKRLTMSKTTMPYTYTTTRCKMDNLLDLRRKLKDQGVVLTVNDFLIKAAALTLECLPQSNAVWVGGEVQLLPSVDISVATATEGGLITPIVRGANRSSVDTISTTVKELVSRARRGSLKPEEFQGGSFSISNLGMYGITEFTAIINPPQTSILAVGGLQVAPNEEGHVSRYINVTLSCDARVMDYELACRWLEVFRRTVESPTTHGLL